MYMWTPTNTNWLHFTKLAVSRLIMVRFEKLKIWHTQRSDADLSDVTNTSRDVTRARTSKVTSWQQQSILWVWLPSTLLWAYLPNGVVDFAHFRQATWYSEGDLACLNLSTYPQYQSHRTIFIEYHDNRLVAMETNALSSCGVSSPTFLPSLTAIGPKTTE